MYGVTGLMIMTIVVEKAGMEMDRESSILSSQEQSAAETFLSWENHIHALDRIYKLHSRQGNNCLVL